MINELEIVATYSMMGVRAKSQRCVFQKRKMRGSRHQCLFEENVRKIKKKGLRILKIRIREIFTHEEGINTPRARHKGQQPLTECAKHDFKIV